MTQYAVVGKSVPRVDGKIKATGEARYTADLKLPGMLYGKVLRSPLPHARILNIDTSKAEQLSGVKAVVTGNDTLGEKINILRFWPELADQQLLVTDKVRYIGDAVAAVAATDERIADEALGLIQVEYEELPAVFNPEEALKEGASLVHDRFERNISGRHRMGFGDVAAGFQESDYVREDRFFTQHIQYAPMEPHACLASADSPGRLTLWTSTQSPYINQHLLATALGMRHSDVRIIKPYIGGGFGGKVELFPYQFCAALLSKKAGKPVMIELTREETHAVTRRKSPFMIDVKTGVKKDGTLVARDFTVLIDGGAYNGWGPLTLRIAGFYLSVPYRMANYQYQGYRVYTNKVPSGPMRGHAAVQVFFAAESQLDMIAEELGIDPVEIRLKNVSQAGDVVFGTNIYSNGLRECIETAAQASGWYEKRGKLPDGQGMGIACGIYVSGGLFNYFDTKVPYSESYVVLNDDGTVSFFTGASDIGQGSDTVLSQIVAEELGVNLEDIVLTAADTQVCPLDLGSFSSRVTMIAGSAAQAAAADAKRQLLEVCASKLELRTHETLECSGGRIFVRGAPDRGMSFAEAVLTAQRGRNSPIMGRGAFNARGRGWGSPGVSFQAQIPEVEIDRETGKVKVNKITIAHDCGKAINPLAVEGQVDGGLHMGLGQALTEELKIEEGKVLNPSFVDYKTVSPVEMPPVESITVETNDPEGPFGAKEVGEGITVGTCPAVANAISDAIGVRIKELPLSPERIIRAINAKEKGEL
jgi:4-hydroxybenzoyl-CoA reductase subunit alpha